MRKYLLLVLSIAACASSFAQVKTGSVKPKRKVVPCGHSIPVISATTPGSRCGKGVVSLTAEATGKLSWYATATGGTSLGKGTSFTTPAISSTTTYYVAATDSGCTSKRAAVTATVHALPAKPVIHASGATELCEGQSVHLSVTTAAPSLLWSTGETSSKITTDHADNYSVTVLDAYGCSAASAPVKIILNPYPYITSITPGLRCGHGQMPLGARSNAGMLRWHTNATDTATISYGTLYFTPTYIVARTDTFYVDAVYRGCVSKRIAVPATVNAMPSIVSTTPGSRIDPGPVTLKAKPSAGIVKWFADSTGGVSLCSDSLFTTTSLTVSKKYYAEASLNGCVSEREAVLAVVSNVTASQNMTVGKSESITAATVAEAPSTRSILYAFRNQGNGHFTVLSNVEGSYTILDKKGKTISTVQLNSANNYMATSETLSNGAYFTTEANNNQAERQKLVVAR